jgi:hypothetical protein
LAEVYVSDQFYDFDYRLMGFIPCTLFSGVTWLMAAFACGHRRYRLTLIMTLAGVISLAVLAGLVLTWEDLSSLCGWSSRSLLGRQPFTVE